MNFQNFRLRHKNFSPELSFSIALVGGTVTEDTEHGIFTRHNPGSAEQARRLVHEYFNDLRDTIQQQENEALLVINMYVREKLCSLRQQQEDMAVLVSQISNVCAECDRALRCTDTEVC